MRATDAEQRPDARQLLAAGRLEEALAAARERSAAHPSDPEPLYVRAVAERYLGRRDAALKMVSAP